MSTDQQWIKEQQRVNTVTDQIERKITTLEDEVGSFRDEVVGMRKDFWDEVTMNFSEADDVGGDFNQHAAAVTGTVRSGAQPSQYSSCVG